MSFSSFVFRSWRGLGLAFLDLHGLGLWMRGWNWLWPFHGLRARFGEEVTVVTGDRPERLLEFLGFSIFSGMSWG